MLVTKDVLKDSRNKNYEDQRALLEEHYAVPGGLEMTISILTHFVKMGGRLYPSAAPRTYTRCSEIVSKNKKGKKSEDNGLVIVGAFGASGFRVGNSYRNGRRENEGLAALRKLSVPS